MIKKLKYLLTFSLLCLGIINFSSAYTCTNGTFFKCPAQYFELGVSSTIDDDYSNTFELLNGVNFLTNSDYKSFQVSRKYSNKQYSSTVYWNNSNLYVYNYSPATGTGLNMKIGSYCLGTTTNHCYSNASSDFDKTIDTFINNSDYYNVDYLYLYKVATNGVGFCLGYDNLDQELCFDVSAQFSNDSRYSTWVEDDIGIIDGTTPALLLQNNLSFFQFSPLSLGGGGNGGDENSGLIYSQSCNKQKALNWYEKRGYSSYLCYGGFDGYTVWDGNPIGTLPDWGTGEKVSDIWAETANLYQGGLTGSTMGYNEWFGYRRQMYSTYYRGGYSINPFINTPLVLFTYFGAVSQYGNDFNSKDILEYCDLKLYTVDYSDVYTGINQNKVCSLLDIVKDNIDYWNGSGNSNNSGNVNIGVSAIDIIKNSLSGGVLTGDNGTGGVFTGDVFTGDIDPVVDGKNFIETFFNEFETSFGDIANNSFGQGILPIYITIALMGLVLFRFMSH